jgi:hypothetical protein
MTGQPMQNVEHCTRKGAEALAARLDAYWHAQGYPHVRHWVEPISASEWQREKTANELANLRAFAVRSNLVNGMPPRA